MKKSLLALVTLIASFFILLSLPNETLSYGNEFPCTKAEADTGSKRSIEECQRCYERLSRWVRYDAVNNQHYCVYSDCEKVSGNSTLWGTDCSGSGGTTKVYIDPNPVTAGSTATVIATGPHSCSTGINLSTGSGLSCGNPTVLTCSGNNPKDSNPCWWKWSCSTGTAGSHQATFNASGTNCSSSVSYSVSSTATTTPAQLAEIRGHVLDQNGVALKDITVEVWNDKGAKRTDVTDQDGKFDVPKNFLESSGGYAVRIPKNQSKVVVTKIETTVANYVWDDHNKKDMPLGSESYEYQYFGANDCAGPDASGTTGRCDFKLTVTATTQTIGGRVVDEQGRGVNGVKVWIADPSSSVGYPGGMYKSVTTSTIEGSPGRYSAQVTLGPQGYFVRVPNSDAKNADGSPIADGVSNDKLFSVADKRTDPPSGVSDNDTNHRSYEFQPGGAGCGGRCNFAVKLIPAVTEPPATSPPSVFTQSFRVAESKAELNRAEWKEYKANGMIVDYLFKDTTPGIKTIFVEFKDSTGKTKEESMQITLLGPDPTITSCSLSLDGNNTILTLTGDSFGSDKGAAKTGEGTSLEVKKWKNDSVQVSWPDAPSDQALKVVLTNTLGQSSNVGACSPVSQLALGAKVFCRQPFSHQTDNVELVLAESFESTRSAKVKQKVSIDKDGVVQGLNKRLEQSKKYTLSVKAPKSLRRSVTFIAGNGTTNIPNFILPVGDIFPIETGDGRINTYDKAELNRQWLTSGSAQGRSADFNQDERVNSIDYACMRVSMPDSIRGEDPEPVAGTDLPVTIFCGGIDNIQCPTGGTCKLDGDYPNASGKCTGVPASSPSPSASPDMVSCTQDSDCDCGLNTVTKQCAVGKKQYITENKQCNMVCSSEYGKFRIICENNVCVPTNE